MHEMEIGCFAQTRWLVITNYFMIFSFGSVILMVLIVLMACYCPVLINTLQPVTEDLNHIPVSNHRNAVTMRRQNKMSFTNTIINALVHRKFHKQLNGMSECIICMEKFENGKSDITPLSHNQEHFFHTKCLEEWLKRNNKCPICRTEIKAEQE
jgi:hypothetical protein